MKLSPAIFITFVLGACATTSPSSDPTNPPAQENPPSPWSGTRLARVQVPQVYVDVWSRAGNRSKCALLAPVNPVPEGANATTRPASFSGGWAVAYDLPAERSAFGVAGSGSSAWSGDVYDAWPHRITYTDSSSVGYGLEGGTGPQWLAYVKIPGQDCLYNIWSKRGRTHLEQLIASLRFVNVS
jgi:hypothetical protein